MNLPLSHQLPVLTEISTLSAIFNSLDLGNRIRDEIGIHSYTGHMRLALIIFDKSKLCLNFVEGIRL